MAGGALGVVLQVWSSCPLTFFASWCESSENKAYVVWGWWETGALISTGVMFSLVNRLGATFHNPCGTILI